MRLAIANDYESLSGVAAHLIAEEIKRHRHPVLLAATGSTPAGSYRELRRMYTTKKFDPARLTVAQLDEYVGVPPDDRRSLFGWMKRLLLDPLEIPSARVLRFDTAADPDTACRAHADDLRRRGIDLAVLGLGLNGHLAFNEPPSDSSAPTRVVALSAASVMSNGRYWGSSAEVPRRAVTVGMDLILASRRILLLVSGSHKAEVLRRTLQEPITPAVPGSFLRLAPDVTVIADRGAWPWQDGAGELPDGIELLQTISLDQSAIGRQL